MIAIINYLFYVFDTSLNILKYIDLRVVDRNGIMLWVLILTFKLITILEFKVKIRELIQTVLLIIFIFISTLRQAWIITIIVLLVILFVYNRYFIKKFAFFLLFLIISFVFIYQNIKFINDIISLSSEAFFASIDPYSKTLSEESTFAFREKVSEAYLNDITNISLIFGKGFGSRPYIDMIEGQNWVGVHNQYVYFLYHLGIFGLLSFIIININILFSLFKQKYLITYNKKLKVIFFTLSISIFYYFFANYSNTFDYVYPLVISFSLILIRNITQINHIQ